MKRVPRNLFRISLSILGFCLLAFIGLSFYQQGTEAGPSGDTGTLEKMIVANGDVAMNIDMSKLYGSKSRASVSKVDFAAEPDAFFTSVVFNGEFRGTTPSSMKISSSNLPSELAASADSLVMESMPFTNHYELAIRDGETGFTYFNVEGQVYDYKPEGRSLSFSDARVVLSEDFAKKLGRAKDAGTVVGDIAFHATLRPIEVSQLTNGEAVAETLPSAGTIPGPDVTVGDLNGLAQFGASSGTRVGLAVGTDSCNFGTEPLNWFALPDNDHSVIPQNMYRMSGGPTNDQRFEQIGQSNVKHAFTALTENICNLGCSSQNGGTHLPSGCSDPYVASLNAGPNLGSRAWINPFTGAYPRGDSGTSPNIHTGHTHAGPTHRILTEMSDLVAASNPGATYYAEAQYVTPHEYAWCQSHPGQCNMYNNVSYRKYSVSGTTSFTFTPVDPTVRQKSAATAWPGATEVPFQPAPGVDGVGSVFYKVTNTSPGVWHYEYAVYNQNLDRAVQSFSIPLANGVVLTNVGFHAPPQQPGIGNDGTVNNAGYSETPWVTSQTGGAMAWNTETFAVNQNANAIRWGTMYNFRFDSSSPPQATQATLGFFKTGSPVTIAVQGPSPNVTTSVTISGQVLASGSGVSGARVTIVDSTGTGRLAITNAFGYYSFQGVPSGTYTGSVIAKRYSFASQVINASGDLSSVNFVAQ